ncbi:MAG: ABC transporter ATP-binding protein [Acidimicrobiales bacterium]|nr:ABC transporter ATP-binding protein [Acidimicrobiales bacterium]
MPAVEVTDLHKSYGQNHAVRGISFEIAEGEVFALLGPNGAGKSTTVEILEGHRTRSSGTVAVLGIDPEQGGRELRDRIGIVLQTSGIEVELTVRELLDVHSGAYRRRRPLDEVIELVGLADKADARIRSLSGGQRRRVDLALGLVGDPELLFLDEPTTGFDPSARRSSWTLIDGLRKLGKTVLLTTHYMDEAQNLADRVAVIARGEIVAEGTPDTLGGEELRRTTVSFRLPRGASVEDLPAEVRSAAALAGPMVQLLTPEPTRVLHALSGWAIERGEELDGLRVDRPSLEDVYLALTGGESGDE